jgi:hypothetical protein
MPSLARCARARHPWRRPRHRRDRPWLVDAGARDLQPVAEVAAGAALVFEKIRRLVERQAWAARPSIARATRWCSSMCPPRGMPR